MVTKDGFDMRHIVLSNPTEYPEHYRIEMARNKYRFDEERGVYNDFKEE